MSPRQDHIWEARTCGRTALLYEEEKGSCIGEVKELPSLVFSEVTFDFGYSIINTLNELAASELDTQPSDSIIEPFLYGFECLMAV